MDLFLHEYLFFVVAIFGSLVSVSAAILFFTVSKYEKKLQSSKRALGFGALAISQIIIILERKFPALGLGAVLIQMVGFFIIMLGVIAEPSLTHLNLSGKESIMQQDKLKLDRKDYLQITVILLALVFLTLLFTTLDIRFLADQTTLSGYIKSGFQIIGTLFILVTIFFQIKRYLKEKEDPRTRLQNLYPLLGYVFLFVMSNSATLYRLPELDIVILRLITLNFSVAWKLSYYAAFVGFVFLAIWAWNFIKTRYFLRVFTVFLTVGIVIATLGSLIVMFLNFALLESDNLRTLDDQAESIDVVMEERLNSAHFVSKLISDNPELLARAKQNDFEGLQASAQELLEEAELDIIKVYDSTGIVIASPSDPREIGRFYPNDELINFVLQNKESVKTFDITPGVLIPTVIGRSLYPIGEGENFSGIIEVGYEFDTAFVDFLSRETTFDITIFTGNTRSATTVTTEDGISRWVGTIEKETIVINTVLEQGEKYQGMTIGLDDIYYSAFSPIKGHDGTVVGMISAGFNTFELFDKARQQLLTSFMLISLISIAPTLLGYIGVKGYKFEKEEREKIDINKPN
ncbi:cache domain-containing protein [Candidatus Dojkabacteria bacterium]|nr:cache domain-containing protein [Candidatus Dojkabacteria bacterium]